MVSRLDTNATRAIPTATRHTRFPSGREFFRARDDGDGGGGGGDAGAEDEHRFFLKVVPRSTGDGVSRDGTVPHTRIIARADH